jgi:folate-dependent phosphoribosylglycinamide formyltransferase PurN
MEIIGTHDLRYEDKAEGGFVHVVLRDADDGDVIIVNEDDIRALRDRLTKTIQDNHL